MLYLTLSHMFDLNTAHWSNICNNLYNISVPCRSIMHHRRHAASKTHTHALHTHTHICICPVRIQLTPSVLRPSYYFYHLRRLPGACRGSSDEWIQATLKTSDAPLKQTSRWRMWAFSQPLKRASPHISRSLAVPNTLMQRPKACSRRLNGEHADNDAWFSRWSFLPLSPTSVPPRIHLNGLQTMAAARFPFAITGICFFHDQLCW